MAQGGAAAGQLGYCRHLLGAFGRRGATTAGTEGTSLTDEARWLLMFLATAQIQGHGAQRGGDSLYPGLSEAQEQSFLSKPQKRNTRHQTEHWMGSTAQGEKLQQESSWSWCQDHSPARMKTGMVKVLPECHLGKSTRAASLSPGTSVPGSEGEVELIFEKDINKLTEPKSLRLTLKGEMGEQVK